MAFITTILEAWHQDDAAPVVPYDLGTAWMALGDSQTGGRWTGAAMSPIHAFYRIWQTMRASGKVTNGMATPYNTISSGSNPYVSGRSGESLAR